MIDTNLPRAAIFDWVHGSAEGYNTNNNSNVGPSSSSASHYYNAAEGGAGQYGCNPGGGEGGGIAGDDALVDFETQQNVHWHPGDMYGSFVAASHISGSSSSNAAALDSVATGANDDNTLQSPSPLDPLLKHLKHKYATSAGPQDVLASRIVSDATTIDELHDFVLNETTEMMMMVGVKAKTSSSSTAAAAAAAGRRIFGQDGLVMHYSSASSVSSPLNNNNNNALMNNQQQQQQQQQPQQQMMDEPPSPLLTGINHPNHQQQQRHRLRIQQQIRRRQLMPNFCFRPKSHTDNLLQTTPHLRHLNITSVSDTIHDGNIFTMLLTGLGNKTRTNNMTANINDNNNNISRLREETSSSSSTTTIDYRTSLLRQRTNRRAALELASFLRLLSNEMTRDEFAAVENEVYAKAFALVHSKGGSGGAASGAHDDRLAGVAALDALLTVPSADEERRAIRFGNNLSYSLKGGGRGGGGGGVGRSGGVKVVDAATTAAAPPIIDYEFLHAVARALGRMAMGAANVDRVEFEVGRGLEWLRSDRSDRRLAAVLVLRELARCAPTTFYSRTMTTTTTSSSAAAAAGSSSSSSSAALLTGRATPPPVSVLAGGTIADGGGTNDFLDNIFVALRDPQPIVRVCAADALSECLAILMERQQSRAMTVPLCSLYSNALDGLRFVVERKGMNGDRGITASDMVSASIVAHGSLLVVTELLRQSRNFILPRFDEVCVAVLKFTKHPLVLLRLEVMRLIPILAHRCPEVFGRRYLRDSLTFLLASASENSTNMHQTKLRIDVKPTAFMSIGLLAMAMSDEVAGGGNITIPQVQILNIDCDEMDDIGFREDGQYDYHIVDLRKESDFQERTRHIFDLIRDNLKRHITLDVLGCFANFVEALGEYAAPYVMEIVEEMFQSRGLSDDMIRCIHSIRRSVPSKQLFIERRLFQEISFCLAGKAVDMSSLKSNTRPILSDPGLSFSKAPTLSNVPISLQKNYTSTYSLVSLALTPSLRPESITLDGRTTTADGRTKMAVADTHSSINNVRTVINKSMKMEIVEKIVLSLRTLRTIGESYMDGDMLLPFLRNVISAYFDHPASSVRQEAVITCCLMMLPDKRERLHSRFQLCGVSASLFEEVLHKLLRMAVSDLSPIVRLCIVRGLDERYDAYLCLNFLAPLFLILEDEALAVRACALQILGRLSRLNPAPILPGLRRVLLDLIVELRCGGNDGGRKEVAIRLIIVFMREEALQGLTRPFISSIIDVLPIIDVAPRLATASLEAIGDIATISHNSINPWLRQLISHILENIQDHNVSKQRICLWALGKVAYGTNYVITPYVDYPQLLAQASDILPTMKRASWDLRREVFRTFGILGAISSDRFGSGLTTTRKGWGKGGGGYFVELENEQGSTTYVSGKRIMPEWKDNTTLISPSLHNRNASSHSEQRGGNRKMQTREFDVHKSINKDSEDDEPAHLFMYEQYAMTSQPLSKLSPARRLSPSDEGFYPTVAVQALMRILKDSSLSNLHGMVMKAVMFIFNALGLKSVQFLKNIVPHILATVKNCNQNYLREALLQQIANLSAIVREHLRPYLPAIFDVVEEFWCSRHLSALCSLVERVATALPDDFRAYVPLIVRQLLASIEAIDLTEWNSISVAASHSASAVSVDVERLQLILKHIQGIKGVLSEYIHLVVPALVKLTDALINPDPDDKYSKNVVGQIRKRLAIETINTLSILLQTIDINSNVLDHTRVKSNTSLPSRVVQPFLRMLAVNVVTDKEVGTAIIGCICICARQLGAGRWVSFYHKECRQAIMFWQSNLRIKSYDSTETGQQLPLDLYDEVVNEMSSLSNARVRLWNNASDGDVSGSDYSLGRSGTSEISLNRIGESYKTSSSTPSNQPIQLYQAAAHKTNFANLQKAWDVSKRSTREDWDEWMRRFSVQLLREAPSPALRACAELAQAYQPLARELFSAAFVCCWCDLNAQYRSNLVFSLEVVFTADASLEILLLLLNLAEFMEHECNSIVPDLGIDRSQLAELALKCRAYARALHYKEREYISGRVGSSVEQLIDINKKLDLPDAALGVLKAAKIEVERRSGRSLVSSLHQSGSLRKSPLEYSVITSYGDSSVEDWSGDIVYESWLAKLGAWAEAVGMYEEKLRENPHDVNSILGLMQCYDARGEWQKALDLAGRSWGALSRTQSIEFKTTKQRKGSSFNSDDDVYKQALKYCSQASWRLSKWDDLENYTSQLVLGRNGYTTSHPTDSNTSFKNPDFDAAFYRAILHINRAEWDDAANCIDTARMAMDSRFTALLAESYKRAYPSMVAAQELSELEEIITYRQLEARLNKGKIHPAVTHARQHLLNVWRRRLDGCRIDAEVHSSILGVRSLVLGPTDEVDAILKLSALSRQAKSYLAERVLLDPLAQMNCTLESRSFGVGIPPLAGIGLTASLAKSMELIVNGEISVQMKYGPHHERLCAEVIDEAGGKDRLIIQQKLYFAYIKHLWADKRQDEAISRIAKFCHIVDLTDKCGYYEGQSEAAHVSCFHVSCWLKCGDWRLALLPPGADLDDNVATDVLVSYKRATEAVRGNNLSLYKAWHSWALINFRLAEQISSNEKDSEGICSANKSPTFVKSHVIAAVKAFVRAISVGTKRLSASVQQDMLNLLSCLFKYGELSDVATTINEGLGSIKMEAWLGVLPQLLARIHIKSPAIRSVLHPLLVRLGMKHPQALMYPLSVLLKSPVVDRKIAAESLMVSLKAQSSALVEEALLVSSELIRVAILWLELWHEGLEDASRLYYGEGNVSGMLDVLVPLHAQLEKGASTRREQDFLKSFGRDLHEAHNHIKDYVRWITESGQTIPTQGGFMSPNQSGRSGSPANAEAEAALNQAWDLYYTVFRRINKQLPGLTTLELNHCSPALFNARNLELGVPGSYRVDGSYIKIQRFITDVHVITSKQRPRKITIRGNDGKDYVFLLKGHEDLRQDERVMQLFGLVNALLAKDRRTNTHDLSIQRYAIAPLSHNAGVVGWVPHCDTLHCLIRDYRETNQIPLNAENREMMALAPNYDSLTVMQKVEIFTESLERTVGKGNDLYEVLWIKSTNSEEWLERRTNFTRSLAVMSMVGYILGLGDRHPSNLMLDQISGRVLHIDFGDCFEVAMHREKFPEKVPFRLTRMLTRAMEVSGIEGSYGSTCNRTMAVLRDNRDSLVAMLEAFVYDPLISWRLLEQSTNEETKEIKLVSSNSRESLVQSSAQLMPEPIQEEQEEDGTEDDDDAEKDGDDEEGDDNNVNDDVYEQESICVEADFSKSEGAVPIRRTDRFSLNVIAPVTRTASTPQLHSTSHAKSLHMYSEIKALAANLSMSSRIASITGEGASDVVIEKGSLALSRIDKSIRQQKLLSVLDGCDSGVEIEGVLNERALKVIRRVQDKLTGTDFNNSLLEDVGKPLDVQDQVHRLILQATSSENLSQLFVGWCAFW